MGKGEFRVDREAKPVTDEGQVKALTRSKCCYEGAWFNLRVRANQDVLLSELEFFGPAEEQEADYWVMIAIKKEIHEDMDYMLGCIPLGRPWYRTEDIIPTLEQSIRGVKKGSTFKVPLPDPVLLEKGLPYLIRFQLNGPDTEQMETGEDLIEVEAEPGTGEIIKFDFRGTRQIPTLYFQMP